MDQRKAELVNALLEVEERIDELWEYHPENPNRIDVEDEYLKFQKVALLIETELDELGGDDRDDII